MVDPMQFFELRALMALFTSVTVLLAAPARQAARRLTRLQAPHHLRRKLPPDYAQWSQVAGCESGGWRVLGGAYPDSLGISRDNLVAFGGTPLPPGGVSRAEKIMQIRTADRLIARYHTGIPDRYGCAAW